MNSLSPVMDAATGLRHGEMTSLAQNTAMDQFLSTVERRAYLMARTALGNHDDALDAVQDAMLLLVRKYSHKSDEEWRLLFFRILHNRIRDMIRRRMVRNRFGGWLNRRLGDDDELDDPFQHVADVESNNPGHNLERRQSMEALSRAVADLPTRQREAFMLRCWEGLSTAETAAVMKCSEGSVKTHYSRALHCLQEQLKEYRDE
ncbi:MAG: RNA polymerase sigma factor [Porticoccaceae bacterium]